ncbi:TonB-dependent receptor [Agaribacter flavus]|uniref:TonB-dependent receptor n=1 Tax=Agaribacter flavus TaxID=1902781 RepID=A0ABV7FLM0_9ALTE
MINRIFAPNLIVRAMALTTACSAISMPAMAQDEDKLAEVEKITVTATRRAGSVQDVPINIAALDGAQLEQKGVGDVSELLRFVPGIVAIDQGGRNGNPIIVRGINADPLGQGSGSDQGGTVATYLGEIPLAIDLRITDLDRVEVLLGPQGTLYGAGTLSGAIRYIPKKPQFDETEYSFRGDFFQTSESDDLGNDFGITLNLPLSDSFAFRAALDRYDDPGFIDQPFIVREIGVSEPDSPRGSDQLAPQEDVNGQESLTGKVGIRWMPIDEVDINLTYYFQDEENEGRTISSHRGELPTGLFENAQRVVEPNDESTDLLALEIVADLGFAELTSATGSSNYEETGQRDQTDLLISLEYSYETFPTFTAFTREEEEEETFNQEIRLVSTYESDLTWIVGWFYNKLENVGFSAEFTPGYAQFAGFDRPDNLEYFSASSEKITERAFYGELAYQITDDWQVTIGARHYKYAIQSQQTVDFPLFDPGFVAASLDEIEAREFDPTLGQNDDGSLFKFNTSYAISDDINLYFTISEGFRIGGVNGGGPCPDYDPDAPQGNCNLAPGQQFGPGPNDFAQFDERAYGPDTTRNHELGIKSQWLDGLLTVNGAVYQIDWEDNQLSSATVNASVPITINANGAESKGFEMSFKWLAADGLRLNGSFSRVLSELSADVPSLVRSIEPPGFTTRFIDGRKGDRLPGSPETQASFSATYSQELSNDAELFYSADFAWQSDILSRTAGYGSSFTLPSFGVANAGISYITDDWTVTAYANNLFDKFAETGVQSTELSNQTVNGASVRSFVTNVLRPRTFGVRFTYTFSD